MLASWLTPDWIVNPMGLLLGWFLDVSKNYGVAIILLTVALRLVILPLTIYQMRSMKRMQEVQPLIKELQTKYKDNPQKLNEEMMGLYKAQGVNPFAGCLPMLVQMPFLYAIFAVVQKFDPTLHGFTTSFLWISDLKAPHEMILTGLTLVSMFLQTYLSGAGQDPNQKMMMYMMPIVFGVMSYNMAGAVVLYWVVSTFFGIAQQAIYPGFPRLNQSGQGAQGGANAR